MFKVKIMNAEGTGAGYGFTPHVTFSGVGVGMSKSPVKARKIAESNLVKAMAISAVKHGLPAGVGFIPIDDRLTIEKDNKVIFDSWRN